MPACRAGLGERLPASDLQGAVGWADDWQPPDWTDGAADGLARLVPLAFLKATHELPQPVRPGYAALHGKAYEDQLMVLPQSLRAELAYPGVATEFAVMLSLLRPDKVQLVAGAGYFALDDHQTLFERKTLVLPDTLSSTAAAWSVATSLVKLQLDDRSQPH